MALKDVRHSLYVEAMNTLNAREDLPKRTVFLCPTCGDTMINPPPETCPACGAPKNDLDEIE